MTDPKLPAPAMPADHDPAPSEPLETAYGSEGEDAIGAEHDGPIKAPDADGGAYVIP